MDKSKLRAALFFPRRILWLIVAFLAVTVVIFPLWRSAVSDPARILGLSVPPAAAERFREELGLDEPLLSQYFSYLGDVVRGEWGLSIRTRQPVREMIAERLGVTGTLLMLAGSAGAVLALLLVLGGILTLWLRDRVPLLGAVLRRLGQVGIAACAATPVFLLGLLLLRLLSLELDWFPAAGWGASQSEGAGFDFRFAVLPVLALASLPGCLLARSVLGEISHYWRVPPGNRGNLLLHALLSFFRHGLILCIGMLGGVVFVEYTFALPGIGQLLMQAVTTLDTAVVNGLIYQFLIIALIFRVLAELLQGLDGFVLLGLQPVEPEEATPVSSSKPPHAKALGWVWIALCLLLILIPLVGGVGAYVTGGDKVAEANPADALLPPGSESPSGSTYAWGTDAYGRDVRSQALHALGRTLLWSFALALLVLVPALPGGLLAGYLVRRGRSVWTDLLDDLLIFPVDVLTSLPGVILLISALAFVGPGSATLLVYLALFFLLPRSMRMVRGLWMVSVPQGKAWLRLAGIVLATVLLSTAMGVIAQAAMGYLGLGISPPTPDLGVMMGQGRRYLFGSLHIALRPGWLLVSATVGWFLLADTVLSRFDLQKREAWLELNR